MRDAKEVAKTPEQIAEDLVDRFSWSSNVSYKGRLVGQQHIVAIAIAEAIRKERDAAQAALEAARTEEQADADDFRTLLNALFHSMPIKVDGTATVTDRVRGIIEKLSALTYRDGKRGVADARARIAARRHLPTQDGGK